ncbi:unnamed protein product [Phytophthora fragariaefolia]|uniref:Unnamed protein product n=1 Tax=Phytophthora fragariaefolia TaxID=1490495 RepID=A0A9W6XZB3_9STRA|nr:unnamed protein product [Phytophthora fragariaefolia]
MLMHWKSVWNRFEPAMELPTTLAKIEAIKNLRFDLSGKTTEPSDLFQHEAGCTETCLRPQLKLLFMNSTSSSFFAYIPISFWQQGEEKQIAMPGCMASRQGVVADKNMVAASWFDCEVVAVISKCDASEQTTVIRQVRPENQSFTAPASIKENNTYMQGVDRLDQFRRRFSLADGHSFKKWHKKLGLALIDIGRSNAYLARRMVLGFNRERDSHRNFAIELIFELLSGKWKESPSERRMFYAGVTYPRNSVHMRSPASAIWISDSDDLNRSVESPKKRCSAVASKQHFSEANRKRRGCVICRWEGRYATEVTDYCVLDCVFLCQHVFVAVGPYACPQTTWTCWEKYHRFYLEHNLFSAAGRVRTSSELYKMKLQYENKKQNDSQGKVLILEPIATKTVLVDLKVVETLSLLSPCI